MTSPEHTPTRATTLVWQQFEDYCENSSIHGTKYLGQIERTRKERVLWVVALVISIVLCAWQVHLVWVKWETTPVILTSQKTAIPSWTVPFPAVTVCSQVKARKRIFNFTEVIQRYSKDENIPTEEKSRLNDMCLVCSITRCGLNQSSPASEDSIKFLLQAAPPLREVVWFHTWLTQTVFQGQAFFTPSLTEEGLCYTFNTLGLQSIYTTESVQRQHPYPTSSVQRRNMWGPEQGYSRTAGIDTYPQRAILGPAEHEGLSLMLIARKKDMDYLCSQSEQGFKVYIHNPAEMPQARHHHVIPVDLNKKVEVSVLPQLTITSDPVRRYTEKQRQCIYPFEKKLRFFVGYNRPNCEMECLANYTLTACSCVPFYMPRSQNMTICNLEKRRSCFKEFSIARQMSKFRQQFRYKVKNTDRNTHLNRWVKKNLETLPDHSLECNCLPSCTSLEYKLVSSTTRDYDWKEFIDAHANNDEILAFANGSYATIALAKVNIKLSDIEFVARQRTELFGLTDFLASCGGLLGLCMGFSVLSLVELIYFCTISLCSRLRRERKRRDYAFKE